jgi:predicted GIY-YIG superfamily endonuclease
MKFHYVYRLVSLNNPARHYVGLTEDLKSRLAKHNRAEVSHTAKHTPWRIDSAHAFTDRNKAAKFEIYLKSHAGREFTKRHF